MVRRRFMSLKSKNFRRRNRRVSNYIRRVRGKWRRR
nr:hypothetical protein CUSKHUHK_CUSKHUHK_CDS_0004 [Microvirus sp.]